MEKLVRDKIPEIISLGRKEKVHYRIASSHEYGDLLIKKLKEEVSEYLQSRDRLELADILEVINYLAELDGLSPAELEELREEKSIRKGGFKKRIVMDF